MSNAKDHNFNMEAKRKRESEVLSYQFNIDEVMDANKTPAEKGAMQINPSTTTGNR